MTEMMILIVGVVLAISGGIIAHLIILNELNKIADECSYGTFDTCERCDLQPYCFKQMLDSFDEK